MRRKGDGVGRKDEGMLYIIVPSLRGISRKFKQRKTLRFYEESFCNNKPGCGRHHDSFYVPVTTERNRKFSQYCSHNKDLPLLQELKDFGAEGLPTTSLSSREIVH